MKETNFTEAESFLRDEAETTPEKFYGEILTAMSNVASIENRRNRKTAESVWQTLLVCADYFKILAGKEVTA